MVIDLLLYIHGQSQLFTDKKAEVFRSPKDLATPDALDTSHERKSTWSLLREAALPQREPLL